MPPSARRPGPGPRSRSRAASRTAAPPQRGCAPAPASCPHPSLLRPSGHLPSPGAPGSRAPPSPGSRWPGPPDIPEIAAHNCTFPGQETSPAVERGPARRPHLPPDLAARSSRSAPAPWPAARPPAARCAAVSTPSSPPRAAAPALLAAGGGSGLGTCRSFPPTWAGPSPPAFRWVGGRYLHSSPVFQRRVLAFSRPHPERQTRHPADFGNTQRSKVTDQVFGKNLPTYLGSLEPRSTLQKPHPGHTPMASPLQEDKVRFLLL
ncbi:vegetative cell wall protein gp1-like [Camelus ferus]|uniref:Vegetative cell wall protein gp1-like n=1 Tax=Camelus ferus TaxID=419612 RepID=A0A8B8UBD5_CAMFR|nr:vegetative cell wall protein gp1-like [Camelus ferus]